MTGINLNTGNKWPCGLFWTLKERQVTKESAVIGCDKCYKSQMTVQHQLGTASEQIME